MSRSNISKTPVWFAVRVLLLIPVLLVLTVGCREPIEILIDSDGVAHVYGRTDADAWYGAGYQTATDRLLQMEMLRRFAQGRLSEVLGEQGLLRDEQALIFDLPRWGTLNMEASRAADPERADLVEAWREGVNRRIEEVISGEAPLPWGYGPDQLDFLPELWEEEDPYIVLAGANFAIDRTVEFEVAMTLIESVYPAVLETTNVFKPAHEVFTMPPEDLPESFALRPGVPDRATPSVDSEVAENLRRAALASSLRDDLLAWRRPKGSNSWAVDGRFTESGRPLVAGDPHMGFDFFGAAYPLHVDSKSGRGSYSVAGFAFPGTPGISLGQTDRAVWTATTAFGDNMDLWRVERADGGVLLGGEIVPLELRSESILVRAPGAPAGEGHVEVRDYEEVPGHGVLLPPSFLPLPMGDFLVGWTGFQARPARWFMELNRVEDLDGFEDSVDRMVEMNYSLVAATAEGISYRVGVEVPERAHFEGPRAPWRALDGADPTTLWTGETLGREQLPGSRATERGWLATANNDPFGFTADGDFGDDPWYFGSFFAPGFRAKRIEEELGRLTAEGGLDLEDMQTLQMDLHSTLADDLLPRLDAAWDQAEDSPDLAAFADSADLQRVVEALQAWDREMARDSQGALVFQAFLLQLAEEVIGDDIPLAYDFAMRLNPVFVLKIVTLALSGAYGETSILETSPEQALLAAAENTGAWLTERLGSPDAAGHSFGEVKVTDFDHSLGFGLPIFQAAADGGEDTINVAQNIVWDDLAGQFVSTHVSVERTVARFAADGTPELWVTYPIAGPADPQGAQTAAALEDHVEGRYRKFLFERDEVEAATEQRIELKRSR